MDQSPSFDSGWNRLGRRPGRCSREREAPGGRPCSRTSSRSTFRSRPSGQTLGSPPARGLVIGEVQGGEAERHPKAVGQGTAGLNGGGARPRGRQGDWWPVAEWPSPNVGIPAPSGAGGPFRPRAPPGAHREGPGRFGRQAVTFRQSRSGPVRVGSYALGVMPSPCASPWSAAPRCSAPLSPSRLCAAVRPSTPRPRPRAQPPWKQ